ncbi:MAG TPA: LysR family transcriptional regulator [Xanthobacteraceae bacterium]|jgi:DNA-binding transcriptional LysR family regulator|nr:LysR family transcriptional regulator [Xanthobacteraceae bacterium]
MHRDIDTALLRAFVAVVETGSVTGAAALLNLTQAAVSQQLKRLEELFGTQLFERHHRRLALRPNGERLLAHAHKLIALNDEVWGAMSAPAYEGEVRLGVPHDIVGPYLPPILRRFDQAWPRVRVSLKCTTTTQLLELLRKGDIDLTLTTEPRAGGTTLLEDELVWAGAVNGAASGRDPLPVSLGDDKCAFRPAVLKALRAAGRDWRPVCEVSSMEPLLASIEADLAIAPLLRSTIPHYLQPIDRDRRLPRLPKFFINLYLPPARQGEIALELARHIGQEFAARSFRPNRNGRPARMLPNPSPSGMLAG